jgi:hypothetical protein
MGSITPPTDLGAAVPRVVDLAAWRERRTWLATAAHLESRGLPPCVPYSLVAWLRAQGIRTAWCNPSREAA